MTFFAYLGFFLHYYCGRESFWWRCLRPDVAGRYLFLAIDEAAMHAVTGIRKAPDPWVLILMGWRSICFYSFAKEMDSGWGVFCFPHFFVHCKNNTLKNDWKQTASGHFADIIRIFFRHFKKSPFYSMLMVIVTSPCERRSAFSASSLSDMWPSLVYDQLLEP